MRTEVRLGIGLVALGLIWFLVGNGALAGSWVGRAFALWPLLLMGLGLDLLGREEVPRVVFDLPYTAVAAAAMVVLGLLYPGSAGTTASDVRSLRLARNGAERLVVRIAPGAANLDLTGRRGGDPAVTGDLRGSRVRLVERGRALRTIELAQGRSALRTDALWSLEVSEALPLDLRIDGGSGSRRLDLERLSLTRLRVHGGSGPTDVALPASSGDRLPAAFDLGSGTTEVRLPSSASVDLDLATGSGSMRVHAEPGADLDLRLDAGSGAVDLDLPDDAPVRLVVDDDGSGPLTLPSWLLRVDGDPDRERGAWQSAAWEDGADRAIRIRIDDAGSGSIRIR